MILSKFNYYNKLLQYKLKDIDILAIYDLHPNHQAGITVLLYFREDTAFDFIRRTVIKYVGAKYG